MKIEILAPVCPPLVSAIRVALKELVQKAEVQDADINIESSEECKKPIVKSVQTDGPPIIITDDKGDRTDISGLQIRQAIRKTVAEVAQSHIC
jgi:hypothetical protein